MPQYYMHMSREDFNRTGIMFDNNKHSRMMKLDRSTSTWQSVSDEGAPPDIWFNGRMFDTGERPCSLSLQSRQGIQASCSNAPLLCTGIMHKDTFCLLGAHHSPAVRQDNGHGNPFFNMRTFDLKSQRWTRLHLGQTPRGYLNPSLIWERCHATGDLPPPGSTCGLTVFEGHGYLLVSEPDHDDCMEVYQLDLATFHWQRLPHRGQVPFAIWRAAAVVVQVVCNLCDAHGFLCVLSLFLGSSIPLLLGGFADMRQQCLKAYGYACMRKAFSFYGCCIAAIYGDSC